MHGIPGIQFDVLSFFLEDPEFAVLWKAYVESERIGDTRVFVMKEQQ